ncbi:TPA: HIT domain-containing protein [Candidatus Saccharibacteria bacterium]|nr:HIT domain-containing protein [Candidatus Saccharibacteria bacterium]HIO87759.1 HIT domain-containing protein [Candidatus Saccharibacteria bacterium]
MEQSETCPFDSKDTIGPDRIIRVGLTVISFLSDPKITEAHVLVVPRRHVEPPYSFANNETLEREHEISRLRRIMLRTGFDGVDVFQKSRPLVAQGHNGTKVDHYHWHVLPSRRGDELYESRLDWSQKQPLTEEDLEKWIPILRDE